MDLDPEGIFRDDSDEDDDNVQVRGPPLCFLFRPMFFFKYNLWLNTLAVTPFDLWMLDCLLGGKQEREANKDMVVYLIDASPKMFTTATTQVRHRLLATQFDKLDAFFLRCVLVFSNLYICV
jgi:ATP-dependent DNA helicase 2 subunit 1